VIGIHFDSRGARVRQQGHATHPGLEGVRTADLAEERGDIDALTVVVACVDADFCQSAIHQLAQSRQASSEHGAGASTDRHGPLRERLVGQAGRVEQVAQLVSETRESLGLPVGNRNFPRSRVLGHGVRDGIIEVEVQALEFLGADRCVQFDRELGHGLTYVPVVVNDLGHRESHAHAVFPVKRGSIPDLQVAGGRSTERLDELIEEVRDSLLQIVDGRLRRDARSDLEACASQDLTAVRGQEFEQNHEPPDLGEAGAVTSTRFPISDAVSIVTQALSIRDCGYARCLPLEGRLAVFVGASGCVHEMRHPSTSLSRGTPSGA
jgi:hypothetical protein